jgi:putative hydrolase of the HAD superfamily
LATNAKESGKDEIIKALKRVGLDHYFKNVFCFRELGVAKPSKAYFDLIVAMLGTDKESIVMVGDSIETDILGAQEYGIDAVLYDPENAYPDYQGLKITNLPELLYIF